MRPDPNKNFERLRFFIDVTRKSYPFADKIIYTSVMNKPDHDWKVVWYSTAIFTVLSNSLNHENSRIIYSLLGHFCKHEIWLNAFHVFAVTHGSSAQRDGVTAEMAICFNSFPDVLFVQGNPFTSITDGF